MAPTGIIDLPAPVQMYLAEVVANQSKIDASSVSKTCKALTGIFQMFLYRWFHTSECPGRVLPPLVRLLRALIETPELGLHVRSLEIKSFDRSSLLRVEEDADMEEDWASMSAASAGVEALSAIFEGKPEERPAAIVSFFLSKMPNLKCLRLDSEFPSEDGHFTSFLKTSILDSDAHSTSPAAQSPLEALQYVTLINTDGDEMQPSWKKERKAPWEVLLLLSLPNLEHLSVAVQDPAPSFWPSTTSLQKSTLASLELSRTRESELGRILSVLPSLKKLTYLWQNDLSAPWDTPLDLDAISTAVLQLKDSLEQLNIFDHTSANAAARKGIKGNLTGFSQLRHLKRLRLPWTFIAGLDSKVPSHGAIGLMLPPTLEELKMTMGPGFFATYKFHDWNDEHYRNAFKAEASSGTMKHCKSLQEVYITGEAEFYDFAKRKWEQILPELSGHGGFRIYQAVKIKR